MRIGRILKERARRAAEKLSALYYAYLRPDTPLRAKAVILLALAYAVSPIDLIPDFIPVLGYLDDLVVLPALIALSAALIPRRIMVECEERALREPLRLPKNPLVGAAVVLLWTAVAALVLVRLFYREGS